MSDNLTDVAETIKHAKQLQLHSAVSVPEHAEMIGKLVALLERRFVLVERENKTAAIGDPVRILGRTVE